MNDDEAKTRRRYYLLLLTALLRRLKRNLRTLGVHLTSGRLSNGEFLAGMEAVLLSELPQAIAIGRTLALAQLSGNWTLEPIVDAYSRAAAGRLIEADSTFLNNFIADVAAGRYTNPQGMVSNAAVAARAGLYAGRAYFAAQQAWIDAQIDDVTLWWHARPECCPDCLQRESDSPFTPATLPGIPGDGSTRCRTSCRCYITTDNGVASPQLIEG